MGNLIITPEWLIVILAAVASLLFSYVPGLRVWFAALETETKRLTMAGITLAIAVGVFLLGCFSVLQTDIGCTTKGATDLIFIYLMALAANQGMYSVSPQIAEVKELKLRQTNKEEKVLLK